MKYYGKRYLYNFLKEQGYDVPKLKEMSYHFYRGSEWLKSYYEEIKVYSPKRGNICVTLREYDEERECFFEKEYSVYVDGILNYQKKKGNTTVLYGKRYRRLSEAAQ